MHNDSHASLKKSKFQKKEARDQALARARLGLPPSHPKERDCLSCDVPFLSLREERMCPQCRARNRRNYFCSEGYGV